MTTYSGKTARELLQEWKEDLLLRTAGRVYAPFQMIINYSPYSKSGYLLGSRQIIGAHSPNAAELYPSVLFRRTY